MAGLALVVVTAALGGLLGGYALWLALGRAPRAADPRAHAPLPDLDVLVALRDEARFVRDKIADLRATQYPGRLRFLLVDGASTDDTRARAARAIAGDPRFEILEGGHAGKASQLNAGLDAARAPWVAVTDADARLDPATLAALVATGAADPAVGVVGVAAEPSEAHALDALYWRAANRLRRAEARRGCVSHVLGPCYVFRRALVPRLPINATSDDCHVAFRAAAAGRRVAWHDAPRVRELRAPRTLGQLLAHKRRKAGGYLREVLRFLPAVRRMAPPARGVFLWRVALLVLGPPLVLGVVFTGSLLAWQAPATAAVALAGAAPLVLAAARRLAPGVPPAALAALAAVLASAAGAALLVHPFRPPSPRIPKVGLDPSPDLRE